MALKHSWTPFQGYIINALKKHLLLDKTYTEWFYNTAIQRGMILMMEHLSLEPDLPLTWEKICRNKTKATHKNLELLLTQAAATVFSGKKYVLEGTVYDQVGKLLLEQDYNGQNLKYIPCCDLPCEFVRPAQEGDLPKLVFLLDVAVDRESTCESLAIFLLNERRYDMLITLEGVKEQLGKIPQKYLKEHWVKMTPHSQQDREFLHYAFSLIEDKSELLYTVNQQGTLSGKIDIFLQNGFFPDSLILDRSSVKVSLRQYLYFLDEIKEVVEPLNEHGLKKIKSTLPAVEKLIEFERKG
jgi:hypothetical protein